jgi:hypothetical protein
MTEAEKRKLQELAGRAAYLARLRDQRRISDHEYIERLNQLRGKHGLWPISEEQLGKDAGTIPAQNSRRSNFR